MKGSGRALELNCLFLLVVALLVALQLILQRSQKGLGISERGVKGDEREGGEYDASSLAHPPQQRAQDLTPSDSNNGHGGGGVEDVLAAPLVPNIRKSFPKRKAPYVRKGKKNKKKKKNRKNKQQKSDVKGVGGGGGGHRESVWVKGEGKAMGKLSEKVNRYGKTRSDKANGKVQG